ncbi:MAG: PIN domain-containing protein [Gemmatimonadaceae bacterium]
MIVYAESSAVLSWLLGEPSQGIVRRVLNDAERVVASSLTAVECARGLARARALRRLTVAQELAALRLLDVAESTWDVHELSDRVLSRARARFPVEPVRTLDAVHLSTAALFSEALGGITLLSFDERIRSNSVGLGLSIAPDTVP